VRVLFAGSKERGVACLRSLAARKHFVVGVICPPQADGGSRGDLLRKAASELGVPCVAPRDINSPAVVAELRQLAPDLTVLAGYGPIVQEPFIDMAPLGCINLHAGKLPQYRGSSPLNWALINGEREFTLSILRVDSGVDTGPVLKERSFPVSIDDTIADLHRTANQAFPELLLEVLDGLADGTLKQRKQDEAQAAYYPLRFPEDGFILWDAFTAAQVHNRVRALAEPYPGAFTWWQGQRLKLLKSKFARRVYHGEPGRVYLKNDNGLLVCAADRCLWIEKVIVQASGANALKLIKRYDNLATLRECAARTMEMGAQQ
jgi:methionyl-tRNA formyltransferase